MKKKRPWVRAMCFCVIISLFLLLANDLLVPKGDGPSDGMYNSQSYGFLAEPSDTIDVFVVGNSNIGAAWSPMAAWKEYGFTSYVSATPWQNMVQTFHLFQMAVKKQHPKVVVLDTDEVFDHRNDMGSSVFEEVFPLFKYHDRWKQFHLSTLNNLGKPISYDWIYDAKGESVRSTVKAYTGKDYMAADDGTEEIPSNYRYFLDLLVSQCQQQGITLILTDVPSAKSWNMKRHNAMQQYAEEKGLAFYDMNIATDQYAVDLQNDFRDAGEHLNAKGAETMTAYLGGILKQTCDLPNRRDDEDVAAAWDKSYENYLDALTTGKEFY